MPFWYHLPVPQLDDWQPAVVRLITWLLDEGTEIRQGTEVAIIDAPSGRYVITANGEGILRERFFPVGAEVATSTPIAVIDSDGENIPYGRPYSLARRIESR